MSEYKPRKIDICYHESPLIGGSFCNGCLFLEVLVKRKRGIDTERYYCKWQRGYFDPNKVHECENFK